MSGFYAKVQRARTPAFTSVQVTPRIESRAPALDHQRARHIPIIGPMAGGAAIPGSRPDQSRITTRP